MYPDPYEPADGFRRANALETAVLARDARNAKSPGMPSVRWEWHKGMFRQSGGHERDWFAVGETPRGTVALGVTGVDGEPDGTVEYGMVAVVENEWIRPIPILPDAVFGLPVAECGVAVAEITLCNPPYAEWPVCPGIPPGTPGVHPAYTQPHGVCPYLDPLIHPGGNTRHTPGSLCADCERFAVA